MPGMLHAALILLHNFHRRGLPLSLLQALGGIKQIKKQPRKNARRQNAARRPKNVIFHFTLPSVFFKCGAGCFKPPPGSIQAASAQKQTSVRLGIFPVHFHYPAYQGFQIPVQDGLDGIRICPHTKGTLHLAGICRGGKNDNPDVFYIFSAAAYFFKAFKTIF